MVSYEAVQRGAQMEVKSVVSDTDKNGVLQWKISCRWAWTPQANTYGDVIYCYQSEAPWGENANEAAGTYDVVIYRGKIKNDTRNGGVPFDGRRLWMWNWKIVRFGEIKEEEKQGDQGDQYEITSNGSGGSSPEFNPLAVGACGNWANSHIAAGIFPCPEGTDPLEHFRWVRDRFYWEVNQVDPRPREQVTGEAPEPTTNKNIGTCPRHEGVNFQPMSDGSWAHNVKGGLCVWDMDEPWFKPNQPIEEQAAF